ncbi:MAG: glycoside hydrolase family 9 protein [Bacteroidales bacterium]|nr:glycoside hydrolase family 9 protein [Bacteroidales bacterium]
MNKLGNLILLLLVVLFVPVKAQQPYIMIDQFGYRPNDEKIAVLADPVIGFNADDHYIPGETTQVRKLSDNVVVFTGHPESWQNGITQESSGDRGWWFDFSAVSTPGEYYIYDDQNKISSFPFIIADDVYDDLLEAAQKMFYYNRCNYPKKIPWAGHEWTDTASHMGPGQDSEARYVKDKDNPATAKDMHGGWYDAGDYNKYITFAFNPVHVLLTAYEQTPDAFSDNISIPESGNGIPDLLDELKWEVDWIKRMQEEDGGVYIKIGYIDYNVPAPPSADKRPRYYGPVCSSSTITASGIFAHAALVYASFPALAREIPELRNRAVNAWKWYHAGPKNEACDDREIKSGDADMTEAQQEQLALTASVYLYALTKEARYHDYIKKNICLAREFVIPESAVYDPAQGDALLYYTCLPDASDSVKNIIFERRLKDARNLPFYHYVISDDLYRAYMPKKQYHWGSNYARACIGCVNYDMVYFSLDTPRNSFYNQHSINQLHYFHGVNPLNLVYISNVKSLGADNCVMRMWGDWYNGYTPWADNPPPGYVTGGPNLGYDGTNPLLKNKAQPDQKMYLDFNNGLPENSWTITEPAIYYQASYIKLLSKFVSDSD